MRIILMPPEPLSAGTVDVILYFIVLAIIGLGCLLAAFTGFAITTHTDKQQLLRGLVALLISGFIIPLKLWIVFFFVGLTSGFLVNRRRHKKAEAISLSSSDDDRLRPPQS